MPVAAARLADVVVGDPGPSCTLGLGDHPLEQLAVALLDVAAAGEPRAHVLDTRRERVAGRARARPRRAPAGRRRRGRRQLDAPRGKAEAKSSPSSRSSAPIWRRRSRRASARRSVPVGRRPAASAAGGPVDSHRVSSSSSGTSDRPRTVGPFYPDSTGRARAVSSRAHHTGAQPHRLLDRDVGDALDLDRAASCAWSSAPTPGRGDGAEEQRQRPLLVGDHERARRAARPAGPRAPRPAPRPDARAALDAVGVERAQRDAGLHDRDRQRVVEQVAAAEPPVLHALERELLDRRRRAVGVEADVAEEDAVGPGDRPLAQVDRVAAVEAVGEPLQALLDLAGAAARAAVDAV